ncbi:MAG TPA: ERCC4 domain-containing protein [Solirubrobacteraceae bacterium]|nr:ERCC4 domain-containing protein [Solirubrobacteraceae bacterium]
MSEDSRAPAEFVVARNPQADSKLPYLVRLPLDGGVVLKVRETWPSATRVYCHRFEEPWPDDAEVIEREPVRLCQRRGAAVDLVLERGSRTRSQFIFTEVRGRNAIFWQTQRTAKSANPGARVPRGRALREPLAILVDTRERYPYKFVTLPVDAQREALPAGDYGVRDAGGELVAAVERKTLDNLATSLSDGSLAFQMGRLAELPLAAVAVEGRYASLLAHAHAPPGWLADQLVRLQARYPQVPVVFLDSRRHAEDWTQRFLATALTDRQAINESTATLRSSDGTDHSSARPAQPHR